MMEKSLHNVSNLSQEARTLLESLVGHPLSESQAFYIVTLDPDLEPSAQQRDSAWDELKAMMADMQRGTGASGLSDAEIDRLIDETCEEVRYSRTR